MRGSIPFTDKLFFFLICFLENKFNKDIKISDKVNLDTESIIGCNGGNILMENLTGSIKNINNDRGYFTLLNLLKNDALDLVKKIEEKENLESLNLFLDNSNLQNNELCSFKAVNDNFMGYDIKEILYKHINYNKLEII